MNEHYNRINHLIESLKEARIYAGAEFEACCNEGEHSRAIYFSGFRDMLATYITSLEDYQQLIKRLDQKSASDRCPICGEVTTEGKKGGKICFNCVNRQRGLEKDECRV